MSYPDPDRTFEERPRFVGEGFRVEPEFRVDSGAPEFGGATLPIAGSGYPGEPSVGSGYPQPADHEALYVPGRAGRTTLALPPAEDAGPPALTAAELNEVFDDPQHGEPGRDRFGVHAIWETVLLLAGAGVAFALTQRHPSGLDMATIRTLMIAATVVGLLGVGAGLTLRAGAVNLALGPVLIASALYFGAHRGDGLYADAGIALLIAAGIGAVIALVVVGLHVPGWAASLAAFVGIQVWLVHLPATVAVASRPDPVHQAYYWFGGFALVAIGGAVIGALHPVRRVVGRFRPVSDPADLRGTPAAVMTAIAIVVSTVLAAFAGILLALQTGGAATDDGISWSALAVAVALVGGTSAYGRRGGITGTVLAASLFVLFTYYAAVADLRVDRNALIAGALLVGVGVTRLVEAFGRPRHTVGGADESAAGWLGRQPATWADHRRLELTRGEELAQGPGADWPEGSGDPWGAR